MKKLLIILCAVILFSGMNLQAAPVSSSRAMDIAKKIFAAQPATKSGTGELKIIWDGEEIATKAAQPAFYVITRDGGGFVIIAGDDNVQPVLAISDHNDFKVEGMPENVKWWMEQIKNYVRSSKSQSNEVKSQWTQFISTKSSLSPITITYESLTCPWDQNSPANELAPTVSGQGKAIAGCLPVAMAEILTWHGWPNTCVGSSAEYSYTSANSVVVNIPSFDLATNLSINAAGWNALRDLDTKTKYQGVSGDTETNLYKLVYACGVILGAHYNDGPSGGTSASSGAIVSAFGDHMGYNKAAYRDFLSYHTLTEWNNLLKAEISKRPVLYCGQASGGGGKDAGHAYVMDGYGKYGEDDVFHINFGWAEYCNGYYYSYYQATEAGYNYDSDFEALFDFYPVTGDDSYYISFVNYSSTPGMKFIDPYAVGSAFRIQFSLVNTGSSTYNGELKAKLINKEGTKKKDIAIYVDSNPNSWTDQITDFNPGSIMSQLYLTVPSGTSIDFGDRIILECSVSPGVYKKITGRNDGTIIYELPVMPTAFIKIADEYHVNDKFIFELMNYDSTYAGTLWTITDPDGIKAINIPQMDREFSLLKSGTYKIEAAVAPTSGAATVEKIVTYIEVQ